MQPPTRTRTRPQPTPSAAPVRRVRALDLGVEEGTIEVAQARYHKGIQVGAAIERRDRVRVPIFATTPAKVRVEGSITRNVGDFNSIRVTVMIEVPAYPEDSEMRRAYNYASTLVDELITNELAQAVGAPTTGE